MIYNDGIPEVMFLAITNDQYEKGEAAYTPSSLNSPAYQTRLIKDREDDIREPASSKIWALVGSSVHYMNQMAAEKAPHIVCEKRYYGDIETKFGTFKIGAQIDILDTIQNAIQDTKVTSVWSYSKEPKIDWVSQLNVQRWCVWKETGKVVDKLFITAVWRDWKKSDAGREDYPSSQCTQIPIPLWTCKEVEAWIRAKVEDREAAMQAPSIADVPPCSHEEVWGKPWKWAVMKTGGSRAVKVFDNEPDAGQLASTNADYYVQPRPGARTRCAGYCPVSQFCPSYQQHLAQYGS